MTDYHFKFAGAPEPDRLWATALIENRYFEKFYDNWGWVESKYSFGTQWEYHSSGERGNVITGNWVRDVQGIF